MATDKRLDQVSTLTDFDYALIVKGDQVAKASKQQLAELVGDLLYGATNASSLASVVAGQMYKGSLRTLASFNSAINPGTYLYTGNIPSELGTSNFGIVVVYQAGDYISQVIYGANIISFRMSYDKGAVWTPFKSINA